MVFLECHSGRFCLIICCGRGYQKLSRDQGIYLVDFLLSIFVMILSVSSSAAYSVVPKAETVLVVEQ